VDPHPTSHRCRVPRGSQGLFFVRQPALAYGCFGGARFSEHRCVHPRCASKPDSFETTTRCRCMLSCRSTELSVTVVSLPNHGLMRTSLSLYNRPPRYGHRPRGHCPLTKQTQRASCLALLINPPYSVLHGYPTAATPSQPRNLGFYKGFLRRW
jgi:hypothetical protein